jgi:hypothetical protein
MEYRIKAHPTRYRGVEFRSRLEATWAAYFDLCEIAWSYEPVDLEGWVPDFVLKHGAHEILAEVKPVANPDIEREPYAKAEAHAVEAWVLLLSREPDLLSAGVLFNHPHLRPSSPEGTPWLDFHNRISPTNTLDLWKRASEVVRWKPS